MRDNDKVVMNIPRVLRRPRSHFSEFSDLGRKWRQSCKRRYSVPNSITVFNNACPL